MSNAFLLKENEDDFGDFSPDNNEDHEDNPTEQVHLQPKQENLASAPKTNPLSNNSKSPLPEPAKKSQPLSQDNLLKSQPMVVPPPISKPKQKEPESTSPEMHTSPHAKRSDS